MMLWAWLLMLFAWGITLGVALRQRVVIKELCEQIAMMGRAGQGRADRRMPEDGDGGEYTWPHTDLQQRVRCSWCGGHGHLWDDCQEYGT